MKSMLAYKLTAILRPLNIILSLMVGGMSIWTVRVEKVPLITAVLIILLVALMLTWMIQAEVHHRMIKKLVKAVEESSKDELGYLELIPDSLIPDPRLD